MTIEQKSESTVTLFTLSEMKSFLRVDNDSDDDLITALIKAAITMAEKYTRRIFLTRQFCWWLDRLGERELIIPAAPILSVDEVKFIAKSDEETILPVSAWLADIISQPARLKINVKMLPVPREYNALGISFTAGYANATIPPPILSAICLLTGFLFERRDGVLTLAGELPSSVAMLLAPYRLGRL